MNKAEALRLLINEERHAERVGKTTRTAAKKSGAAVAALDFEPDEAEAARVTLGYTGEELENAFNGGYTKARRKR